MPSLSQHTLLIKPDVARFLRFIKNDKPQILCKSTKSLFLKILIQLAWLQTAYRHHTYENIMDTQSCSGYL